MMFLFNTDSVCVEGESLGVQSVWQLAKVPGNWWQLASRQSSLLPVAQDSEDRFLLFVFFFYGLRKTHGSLP